jgi:hypothetical protein
MPKAKAYGKDREDQKRGIASNNAGNCGIIGYTVAVILKLSVTY